MDSIPEELRSILEASADTVAGKIRFRGTRIPVKLLFDYVLGGEGLDEFLAEFPDVKREHAQAVLEWEHSSVMERLRLGTAA